MDTSQILVFDKKSMPFELSAADRSEKTLHYLVNDCARQHPDKTAISFYGSELSYRNLWVMSTKLAKLLIDDGVKKGDIIAIALDRSPEMVISLLAILKSGAAYLPLDPDFPKERIEFMLKDSSAKILITLKKYQNHFNSDAKELLVEHVWDMLDEYDASEPEIEINGDDIAYLLYTSGSTGMPKAVLITQHNFVNFLLSMQRSPGITPNDKLLAISTISFDIAGLELFLPLISGAEVVLADAATAKDGRLLLDIIKCENISIMQATPYTWRMLLQAGWDQFLPLKVISGGETLTIDLAEKLLGLCHSLWNLYGPTETTVYSAQKHIENIRDITIGSAIDNTTIYILNENLDIVTGGIEGEIVIAGDGVAKGYLNRPELTAEKFISNPFSQKAGELMYRTGDLGKINSEGELEFLGRIDQQMKVRGYRIEPAEIEYALLKEDGIKEALVITRDDVSDETNLVAYIASDHDGHKIDLKSEIDRIKKALLRKLPVYMLPDYFVFVTSIPVTPNGKIDRKLLPKPQFNLANLSGEYTAPRSDAEKLLVNIWQELMGVEKISVNDDFFSLGGHSLVAVQIMVRIEKGTGKRLPLATLFEHSTIAKLALCLDTADQFLNWNSLVPIKPKGSKTPLYIVHGEGLTVLCFNTLARHLDADQPVYGLQARGLKAGTPPDTIEGMASKYINEVIAQNPEGPYFLAGYSVGGYIAVEMRKQMTAIGKKVKVIIFDTDAEKANYRGWAYLLPKKIKRHVPLLVNSVKAIITHPGHKVKNAAQTLTQKKAASTVSDRASKKFYEQIEKTKDSLKSALGNYSLEPFDDKIYLFKANTCTHYSEDTEFLGWKKYATRGVEMIEVPGDHLSMLLTPNAEEFAASLQSVIDNTSGF